MLSSGRLTLTLLLFWNDHIVTSSVTAPPTGTTGGNGAGAPCHFPFLYEGDPIYTCILTNWDRPWCSITRDYDTDRKWGECSLCPDLNPSSATYSLGGERISEAFSVMTCYYECIVVLQCVGFDLDESTNTCFGHTASTFRQKHQTESITQYTLGSRESCGDGIPSLPTEVALPSDLQVLPNVTSTSLTISFESEHPTGNGQRYFEVQYKSAESNTYIPFKDEIQDDGKAVFVVRIENLEPETQYRIRTRTRQSTSPSSANFSMSEWAFVTGKTIDYPTVEVTRVYVDSTRLVVNWMFITPFNIQNGNINMANTDIGIKLYVKKTNETDFLVYPEEGFYPANQYQEIIEGYYGNYSVYEVKLEVYEGNNVMPSFETAIVTSLDEEKTGLDPTLVIGLAVGSVLFLCGCVVIVIVSRKILENRQMSALFQNKPSLGNPRTNLNKMDIYYDPYENLELGESKSGNEIYSSFGEINWDCPRDSISILDVIYTGQFCIISTAHALDIPGISVGDIVAIKELKDMDVNSFHPYYVKIFYDEIKALKVASIDEHKNIMNMLGCGSLQTNPFIIMNRATKGDLRNLLLGQMATTQKAELQLNVNPQQIPGYVRLDNLLTDGLPILNICRDILNGMIYIIAKGLLHPQLTTDNILVMGDLTCRISGFMTPTDAREKVRFSKSAVKSVLYWHSPETLDSSCLTTESNVWSYGILLWSIYTSGSIPFTTTEHEEILRSFIEGRRPDKPSDCPDDIYEWMRSTWRWSPQDRPKFEDIRATFQNMPKNYELVKNHLNIKTPVIT